MICLFWQPSAELVKEVTAFSKECLEKIEKSRSEGDYHEVLIRLLTFHLPNVFDDILCRLSSNKPLSCAVWSRLFQVAKLCRECLGKQENVLADTHVYKLRVFRIASEVLSYLRFFPEAAEYAQRMVEGYM